MIQDEEFQGFRHAAGTVLAYGNAIGLERRRDHFQDYLMAVCRESSSRLPHRGNMARNPVKRSICTLQTMTGDKIYISSRLLQIALVVGGPSKDKTSNRHRLSNLCNFATSRGIRCRAIQGQEGCSRIHCISQHVEAIRLVRTICRFPAFQGRAPPCHAIFASNTIQGMSMGRVA